MNPAFNTSLGRDKRKTRSEPKIFKNVTFWHEEAEEAEQEAVAEVPSVSCLTDMRAVRRQLISYDATEDLLPMLSAFSVQSIGAGQGASLEYDMGRLETALSALLLGRGAAPLTLAIRHFHYHGELQGVGLLGALGATVPQRALPLSVLDTVWGEVSTAHRLARLLALLETHQRADGSVRVPPPLRPYLGGREVIEVLDGGGGGGD